VSWEHAGAFALGFFGQLAAERRINNGRLEAFPAVPFFREIRAVIERDYLRVSERLAAFAEDRGAHPFHPIINLQGRKYRLGKR
jgi:hypothetical protein